MSQRIWARLLISIGLVAMAIVADPLVARAAANDHAPQDKTADQSTTMPEREQEFIRILADARKELGHSRTPATPQNVRMELQVHMQTFWESDPTMRGWTGVVEANGVTQEGEGWITIDVAPGVAVGTPKIHAADVEHWSLITQNSPVFPFITKVQFGERVRFDGKLVRYVNANDDEMIAQPRIFVHFDKIESLDR